MAQRRNELNSRSDTVTPTDRSVTEALVAARGDFLRFLTKRLGDRDTAEDVLQEVFLKVLAKSGQVRDARSVRSWLNRVVSNALADHWRKQSSHFKTMSGIAAEALAEPNDDRDVEAAVCECLHDLLPALAPRYAEVLRRVDMAGEPRPQVARDLDISPGNLRVLLHRARQSVRDLLLLSCLACGEHRFLACNCQRPLAPHQGATEKEVQV